MKLNAARVDQALSQFEAQAIPGDHPVVPQLNRLFGEHTFFLNGNGLHVVEAAEAESDGRLPAQVVKLASWKDADRTSLTPHKPEPTDVMVVLAAEDDEDAEFGDDPAAPRAH